MSQAQSTNPPFVHPSSIVEEGAVLEDGVKVWHFCHVMPGAHMGAGTSLGQNGFVASNVRIGANVKIQNNVSLYEGLTIEDDVFLGPSCVFTNVRNPRSAVNRRGEYESTLVQRGRHRWRQRHHPLWRHPRRTLHGGRRRRGHPRCPGLRVGGRRARQTHGMGVPFGRTACRWTTLASRFVLRRRRATTFKTVI